MDSLKMPDQKAFNNSIKRGSLNAAWWRGEISEGLLLEELARIERDDGLKVVIPFPVSAIAMLAARPK